jgi:N-acetylglucosaminyldiphosphoundecaprenol N-acetyl-beta-D-mannosaminyltransferase
MGIAESCRNERLHESMGSYDHLLPDGRPLLWLIRAKGHDLHDVIAGPHLVDRVLSGLERPTKVAVIGGYPDEHDRIREASEVRYPCAVYSLMYDAPAGEIDQAYVEEVVGLIEGSGAELVFICLGVPRQYYLTALAKTILPGRVYLSVGGAFLYMTGQASMPPDWVQRSGLWWLYRLYKQPRRLWRRYARYNSLFLWFLFTREIWPGRARSSVSLGTER